jgi:hypothetical protein
VELVSDQLQLGSDGERHRVLLDIGGRMGNYYNIICRRWSQHKHDIYTFHSQNKAKCLFHDSKLFKMSPSPNNRYEWAEKIATVQSRFRTWLHFLRKYFKKASAKAQSRWVSSIILGLGGFERDKSVQEEEEMLLILVPSGTRLTSEPMPIVVHWFLTGRTLSGHVGLALLQQVEANRELFEGELCDKGIFREAEAANGGERGIQMNLGCQIVTVTISLYTSR